MKQLVRIVLLFSLLLPVSCAEEALPGSVAEHTRRHGEISIVAAGAEDCRIRWQPVAGAGALDRCEYRVVISTNDDIGTLAGAMQNGQVVLDFLADTNACRIYPLADGRRYFVNVVVRDGYDNHAVYRMREFETIDRDAARPGDSGRITVLSSGSNTLTIGWVHASDRLDAPELLQYRIYHSRDCILDTRGRILACGVPAATVTGTNVGVVSNLEYSTKYSLNILVENSRGVVAAYSVLSAATLDDVPPVPGGGGLLQASEVGPDGLLLTWSPALDPLEAQAGLEYRVYYGTNGSGTLASLAGILADGIAACDWTADLHSLRVTGLRALTWTNTAPYQFNVLVRDTRGNIAVYQELERRTTWTNGNHLINSHFPDASYWHQNWYPGTAGNFRLPQYGGSMYCYTAGGYAGKSISWRDCTQPLPWVPGEAARVTMEAYVNCVLQPGGEVFLYFAFMSPGGTSLGSYEAVVNTENFDPWTTPQKLEIVTWPAPYGTTRAYIEIGVRKEATPDAFQITAYLTDVRVTRITN